MNRLFWVCTLAIFTLVCTSMAVDITGSSGKTTYSNTDVFGTILGTIPSVNPGPSNAWCGIAYAGGFIYQIKNVASPIGCHLIQVNPSTGAVVNDYTLGFAGYGIGAQYDGSGIWVAQFYPSNTIYKVSLTGTTISSFTPVVAPYSARSIGWDGTNLLVGCNQSSGVTELVKYTPAGVMVGSPISSGSVVGWYMDGEVCADAPAGNYYIVDNVGNTLKRLVVTTTVTLGQSVASPAVSPDVAEGIGYNGDDLWHCGAYSSLGVLWRIDDGYVSLPLDLQVTITPTGSTVIGPGGGVIPFTITVLDNTSPAGPYAVWARVKNPDGSYNPPNLGPVTINTPTGVTITRYRNTTVPGSWVAGGYWQLFYAGMSFGYPPVDADSFSFTKTVVGDAFPWVEGPSVCYGDLFPGEVAVSAPASYTVASAYPNPFNPTTTIHFTLPEASKVTLNVYDMNGRLVTTLVNGLRDAGQQDRKSVV